MCAFKQIDKVFGHLKGLALSFPINMLGYWEGMLFLFKDVKPLPLNPFIKEEEDVLEYFEYFGKLDEIT